MRSLWGQLVLAGCPLILDHAHRFRFFARLFLVILSPWLVTMYNVLAFVFSFSLSICLVLFCLADFLVYPDSWPPQCWAVPIGFRFVSFVVREWRQRGQLCNKNSKEAEEKGKLKFVTKVQVLFRWLRKPRISTVPYCAPSNSFQWRLIAISLNLEFSRRKSFSDRVLGLLWGNVCFPKWQTQQTARHIVFVSSG